MQLPSAVFDRKTATMTLAARGSASRGIHVYVFVEASAINHVGAARL